MEYFRNLFRVYFGLSLVGYMFCSFIRGYIEVRSNNSNRSSSPRQLIEAWFKERAHLKFAERLEICLDRFPRSEEFRPVSMIVRRMTKRWGSMTPSTRLILNFELIHAPVDAIDYVITHEL